MKVKHLTGIIKSAPELVCLCDECGINGVLYTNYFSGISYYICSFCLINLVFKRKKEK
jgi:hypothetical protein